MCIVVVVLCVLLIVLSCFVCIDVVLLCLVVTLSVLLFFTLDAGLLARSQYSKGPATGHLDTGISWFPYKRNYKNDSIMSVDMDVVGVVAAYSNPLYVCLVHCSGNKCLHEQ